MLILLIVAFVGLSIADDDDKRLFLIRGRRPRPLLQLLRPLAGRPLIGGGIRILYLILFTIHLCERVPST